MRQKHCFFDRRRRRDSCHKKLAINTEIFLTDIDECAVDNGGCEGQCVNRQGSYQCFCSEGFRLASNGKKCIGTYLKPPSLFTASLRFDGDASFTAQGDLAEREAPDKQKGVAVYPKMTKESRETMSPITHEQSSGNRKTLSTPRTVKE